MITDLLLRHSALVPVLLLLVALATAALGLALVHREGRTSIAIVLGLSLLATAALVLAPAPTGRTLSTCAVQFSVPRLGSVELLANIALFIPIGCFAALLSRHPILSFLAASSVSAFIEATQAAIPAIGRACDTNDWAMNSAGALIGALIAATALAFDRFRRSRRSVT